MKRRITKHFPGKDGLEYWDVLECGHYVRCNSYRHVLDGSQKGIHGRRARACVPNVQVPTTNPSMSQMDLVS